jgi:hypothetical protein
VDRSARRTHARQQGCRRVGQQDCPRCMSHPYPLAAVPA